MNPEISDPDLWPEGGRGKKGGGKGEKCRSSRSPHLRPKKGEKKEKNAVIIVLTIKLRRT